MFITAAVKITLAFLVFVVGDITQFVPTHEDMKEFYEFQTNF